MSCPPLVSVILPVYNVERYLGACLESLKEQSYPSLQIIAVNDGSTDKSSLVLESWQAELELEIIEQKNAGLSCARNRGLQEARGKYVLFVDSDDTLHPSFVETLVSLAEKEGSDLVCCGTEILYEAKEELRDSDQKFYQLPFEGTRPFSYEQIERLNPNVWNKLFLRDIIQQHQLLFPTGLYYEDVGFLWLYYAYCQQITCTSEKLYVYYRRQGSIMDQTFNGSLEKALDHLKIALFIQEEYSQRALDKKAGLVAFVRVFLGLYGATLRFIPTSALAEADVLSAKILSEIDFPRCARFLPFKLRHRLFDVSLGRRKTESLKIRHFLWEIKRFFRSKS